MRTPVWNLKAHYDSLYPPGTPVSGTLPDSTSFFDCMLAEFLLAEGRYYISPEATYKHYGVTTLEELAEKQQAALEALPQMKALLYEIEIPTAAILWKMERNGITVDRARLEELGTILDKEIQKVVAEVDTETLMPVNLASPLQVGAMLVDTFGVPLQKSQTGKYATGEQELVKHVEKFPIVQKVLTYRMLAKLKSTYVEGLLKKISDNGRIHTTYNQAVAITGRLSSTNPNLQNIPGNSEIGIQIKSCFIPSKGYRLVALDYSQQELRILAHITKEPALIEAFASNRDVHTVTASTLFKTPYEEVTKAQRGMAKTINFGVLYGMGGFGLSQSLKIPVPEADQFIADFFKNFAEIRKFYFAYLKEAGKNKYAETIMGRRRYVEMLNPATRRELANYPIQGAAADLMKKAMVEVDREILSKRPEVRMLLQIHDELVFEIPEGSEEALQLFIDEVKEVMEHVYEFSVPMKVEAKVGKDWGSLA